MTGGERLTLVIEKLIHGGDGLARHDQHVVFVPGGLPGETVTAEVTRLRKGYAEARLITVATASPHRVAPPCPVFGDCGGCQLQHAAYQAQATMKAEVLREDLRRLGRLEIEPDPVVTAPAPYGYRRRARLRVLSDGPRPRLGLYAQGSHRVVPIESCPVLHPRLNEAMQALASALERAPLRTLGEIGLHHGALSDDLLITLSVGREARNRPSAVYAALQAGLSNLTGMIVYHQAGGRRVFGRDHLMDRLKTLTVRQSDRAFAQTYREMNDALIDHVIALAGLTGREQVAELYCGTGNLTLFLAQQARAVVAMDANPYALADARLNAQSNGMKNITLFQYDSEIHLKQIIESVTGADLLVLDPPRGGLTPGMIDGLAQVRPARVLYISCEPATCARDLRQWVDRGYRVSRVQPLDMFPQTAHLEVIAALDRLDR